MDKIVLYHGSKRILHRPEIGKGKAYNDFGRGFYCSENEEIAREWACFDAQDGYVNKYELKTSGLKILDLTNEKDRVLKWLALLLTNRRVRLSSTKEKTARDFIVEHYLMDISDVDIIIGARGDDSYFSFARAFLSSDVSLGQLDKILFTKESRQYVLKSERAIKAISFVDVVTVGGSDGFYMRRVRDVKLIESVHNIKEKSPVHIGDIIER